MKIHYEKELNPAQYEAVSQTDGAFLVIAGAGSGKTRTLVYRVARLVESGIAPENILLLTFTRKASSEMLFRASLLLDDRCSRVSGGTFHSVANQLLRKYGSRIGLGSHFTIMDAADAADCVNLLKTERGYGKKHKQFPRKSTLSAIFSLSVNKRVPLDALLLRAYPQFLEFMEEIEGLHSSYTDYKKKHHLLDYDDLLVYFKEALEVPEVQAQVEERYGFVMVDEFQDTNILQGEIIALLGKGRGNIMAVGDPAQCIYSFRGANFENIPQFENFFPSMRVIKLEENYRSTQKVLAACNALMLPAREKFSKNLFTKTRPGGVLPCIVGNENSTEEACFIVDSIEDISRDHGIDLKDMAVLFRNSFHSFELELELNKRGIPFVKYGGFKFVETAHIKDILAHLRVTANPSDTVSWTRLLLLVEGMGPRTAMKVVEKIGKAAQPFSLSKLKDFQKFAPHFRELDDLFAFLLDPKNSPSRAMEKVLEYYIPLLEEKYDDHPKRKRDLDQLLGICAKYKNLGQLLTDMTLEPPNTSRDGNLIEYKGDGREHLTLSTVHSAKGLEWDTVFIIGANEGSFPSPYSVESEEELEEERRLFYVAATRAKDRLYFTYASQKKDRYGQFYRTGPSQFLDPLRGNGLVKETGGRGY